MYKIRTYNQISARGLDKFEREHYEVSSDINAPDAIMLRSHKLAGDDIPASVQAVGRAGAGVNNVPLELCTERGIPVFNAPGANANAVKELVLCGLLLSSRGIIAGIDYVRSQDGEDSAQALDQRMEKEKKRFKGQELAGKTLGVVGLGAIGSLVARAALMLDMNVIGYDPALSVDAAWRLPSEVGRMENISSLFAKSDYVTLHLPVLDSTRNLVDTNALNSFKKGAVLLNFSRSEIVSPEAVVKSIESDHLGAYICDFPHPSLHGHDRVIAMPHIGASTAEAEENCAFMVVDQLKDFLENGNIRNSVNFPALTLERSGGVRIAITNTNVPKMLGNITTILADAELNVLDLLNKSRGDIAYNLIDVEVSPSTAVLDALRSIDGVINVRIV